MQAFDKDTLELIQKTAVGAAGAKQKVHILELPGDPHGDYIIVKDDGSYEIRKKPRIPGESELMAITDISTYLAKLPDGGQPGIWYTDSYVRIISDMTSDRNAIDVCFLQLGTTPEYKALAEIEKKLWTQKEFVKLLRVEFGEALTDRSKKLLELTRKLEFKAGQTTRGEVNKGRQSYGRDIEQSVGVATGADDLPEETTLCVRMYQDNLITIRQDVRLYVEIEFDSMKLQLIPFPGDVEGLHEINRLRVRELLEEQVQQSGRDIPIFFGAF